MKNLSFIIIGLLLSFLCNSQTLKQIDWAADIDFLAKELPQKHYDFFTLKSKKDFLAGLDKIKLSSKQLSDIEIALKLQQLIAGFGDSHTLVDFGQFIDKSKILPLRLYWFSDGLHILQTTQENAEILGHQIIAINEVSLKIVTDSLSSLITIDNQAIVKKSIPNLFPCIQVLEYFGFTKGQEVMLELKDLHGIKKTYAIKPSEMNRQNSKVFNPDSIALCNRNERAYFIDYYQSADNIYYLQYNNCWSKELEIQYRNGQNAEKMPSFKQFEEKVFETINKNPINKVVFDVRFNGGGNSSQGTQFIEELAKVQEKNSKIKIYVIIGRNTFSSAILNAMDFKRLTNAIFIGEETSGKPNHFGEVRNFQLPSSGIRIGYSTKYFKRTDEKINTISPDIKLEISFSDYVKGIDPAYEWIKKQ